MPAAWNEAIEPASVIPSSRTWPSCRLAVGEDEVRVDGLVALALAGVDPDLLEERVHAEGAGLVGDDRHDAPAEAGSRIRFRSSLAKTIVVLTAAAEPAANSASASGPGRAAACDRTTRLGREPPSARRRSSRYWISGESGPGWKYGASLSFASGIGSSRRSRKTASSASESFFAWWVMLRPSTPGPSVQPLIVLARMTVGAPRNSVAAR